jgi:hypothetical protein
VGLQELRTARALATCRSIRTGSVSMPCSSRNADSGARVGPSVRAVSIRARIVKPKSPKVS